MNTLTSYILLLMGVAMGIFSLLVFREGHWMSGTILMTGFFVSVISVWEKERDVRRDGGR